MALSVTCSKLLDSQQAATGLESYRFITDMRAAGAEDCHEVVGLLKHTIKAAPSPAVKLRAFTLLHRCVMTANHHILLSVTTTALKFLGRLARHRKDSSLDRRGEDLFSKECASSYENRSVSAEFLTTLLTNLRIWATRFGQGPDSQPTKFKRLYEDLVSEGVVFPSETEPAIRPKTAKTTSSSGLDVDSILRSVTCLEDLLHATDPDKRSMTRLVETLTKHSQKLQDFIQNSAGVVNVDLETYLQANDAVKEVLQQYQRFSDVSTQRKPNLVEFNTDRLGASGSQQEITLLKTENRRLLEEIRQKELEIRRIETEYQAKIEQITAISMEKDAKIAALQESLARFVPPTQSPYINSSEFRLIWTLPEGLLVNMPELKVKFQLFLQFPRFQIRLFLKNTSGTAMEGLCTKVVFQPGEGIQLGINKEMEGKMVTQGDIVEREIRGEVQTSFPGAPGVAVTCVTPPSVQVMAFLPVTVWVGLLPAGLTTGQIVGLWTQYEAGKVRQKFQLLQSGSRLETVVELLRFTGKCQICTFSEIPILGSSAVLAVSRWQNSIVLSKVKLGEVGGSLTVTSSDSRLRDCVLSALVLGLVSQL